MKASFRELEQAAQDLELQGTACSWEDPATGEVCGGAPSHVGWELVSAEPMVQCCEYRCMKHAEHDDAIVEAGDHCDELLNWERVIEKARGVETKEQVLAILERERLKADRRHAAELKFGERLLEIDGPGTVAEINEIYDETVGANREETT